MDSCNKVLCWRIAMGEEKELVKEFKEDIDFYKKEGLEDFLYAVDFDSE